MKHFFTITMFAAMALCCGNNSDNSYFPQGVATIGVEEFSNIIEGQKVRLIDVRTPKEYAEGHIPNAENIDVKSDDFSERIKNIKGKVAVYCRSGKRSLTASEQFSAQGCTVYNLEGGIMAWQRAGKPIVKQ